jgi:uncharacterized integral membrane protein
MSTTAAQSEPTPDPDETQPIQSSSPTDSSAPASEPSREELLKTELRDLDHQTKDPLRGSRTSGVYASVIGLGVVLVLLIIFIAQNTAKAPIKFLGWSGSVSVAVAMLIAAAAGIFLAGMAGLLRILQLRRRVKRETKALRKERKARAAR